MGALASRRRGRSMPLGFVFSRTAPLTVPSAPSGGERVAVGRVRGSSVPIRGYETPALPEEFCHAPTAAERRVRFDPKQNCSPIAFVLRSSRMTNRFYDTGEQRSAKVRDLFA